MCMTAKLISEKSQLQCTFKQTARLCSLVLSWQHNSTAVYTLHVLWNQQPMFQTFANMAHLLQTHVSPSASCLHGRHTLAHDVNIFDKKWYKTQIATAHTLQQTFFKTSLSSLLQVFEMHTSSASKAVKFKCSDKTPNFVGLLLFTTVFAESFETTYSTRDLIYHRILLSSCTLLGSTL